MLLQVFPPLPTPTHAPAMICSFSLSNETNPCSQQFLFFFVFSAPGYYFPCFHHLVCALSSVMINFICQPYRNSCCFQPVNQCRAAAQRSPRNSAAGLVGRNRENGGKLYQLIKILENWTSEDQSRHVVSWLEIY